MPHRLALAVAFLSGSVAVAQTPVGYYRQPSLHGDLIVFVAEGDLWKVPVTGGVATRLTSHPGDESTPDISPDGDWVAFVGTYEGPQEVYVLPTHGGLPKRLTWDARRAAVVGWKGDRIIATTDRFSTLPSTQLTLIDPVTAARSRVPLAEASDGTWDPDGRTLFFTRMPFQGSQTKRYKGGTAQQLWRYIEGEPEATPLTKDFPGTSTEPMWWNDRVYFASDRDGTMEIWSMNGGGQDLIQHTRHDWLDVKSPSLSNGRIVFQLGADLHLFDIATGTETPLSITLDSDFDQTRENWVKNPLEFLTASHISPDGQSVVMTARGQVFVAPRGQGRLAELTRSGGVRYRDARFMPDGKSVLALSDESGEVELWTLPLKGDEKTQLTSDGKVLRWEGIPSPDGAWIAHHDKNQELWLLNTGTKEQKKLDFDAYDNISGVSWSADSRWLAWVTHADNLNQYIKLFDTASGAFVTATSDRYVSNSPVFSPSGEWLYFISERTLASEVDSPWGYLAPEPYFNNRCKVYALALKPGLRFPFAPDDELHAAEKDKKAEKSDDKKPDPGAKPADDAAKKPVVEITTEGLAARLYEVPGAPGNFEKLAATDKRLLWISRKGGKPEVTALDIARKDAEPKTLVPDCGEFELSADGKSLLVRKKDELYVIDAAAAAPASLDKSKVDLSSWAFALTPREEWRQMFRESWRLMRDYFYDTDMHGVDWKAMLARYEPLVDRVSSRAELSDLISQMVGELSALHHFVRGGDLRVGDDKVRPGMLGGILIRDENAGGFRIEHVFLSDSDEPGRASPLARPGVDARAGDVITRINGRPALSVPDPAVILRNQIGRQVLLSIKPKDGAPEREAIVTPISPEDEADQRDGAREQAQEH
ncbi:MAG: S41 family peptidase, partial [Phycisphaerales bacterium]